MKNLLRNALVTLASFVFVINVVHAWTGPKATPPGDNADAPVNIGAVNQIKAGGLGVASLLVSGKAVSASTIDADLGGTLVTKDYLDSKIADLGGSAGGSGVTFKRITNTWGPIVNGTTYSVSCPANYVGASCEFHYYDNNGGGVYHGYTIGTWNASRTQCTLTVADNGITDGQMVAECATGGGGGGSKKIYSGTATVGYTNGQAHSSVASVSFPSACTNPVVVAMPGGNAGSIACDDGTGHVGKCANLSTSASQDLNVDVYSVTSSGFRTSLSGESGSCVGVSGAVLGVACLGVSPAYEINWIATCD